MIPKIIHYCWFGRGPLPDISKKYIEGWEKLCPDYEIKEWNEDNFDINFCDYTREAYEHKKYAFVSDVARLYALVTEGGIYMDTDVELLKPVDNLLTLSGFSSFELSGGPITGLMASEAKFGLFEECLSKYKEKHFVNKDGSFDMTTNVEMTEQILFSYGLVNNDTLQTVNGFTIFPHYVFCPDVKKDDLSQSVAIHHFAASWVDSKTKKKVHFKMKIYKILCFIFGKKFIDKLRQR